MNLSDLLRRERAYPYTHANSCGARGGGCFVPSCRCDCHTWARREAARAIAQDRP